MKEYYQLKYYVTESFYEFIVEEGYSIEQSFDRCTVEFMSDLSGRNMKSLIVYSTLLSRVALHEPEKLKRLQRETDEMNRLFASEDLSELSIDEREELTDDIDMINWKIKRLI